MDGNEKFFVAVWSLVAAVVITLMVSVGCVTAYKAEVLRKMVEEQKVDPMRAACALDIGERKDGVCSILAANQS
jgi:hypothetical protein